MEHEILLELRNVCSEMVRYVNQQLSEDSEPDMEEIKVKVKWLKSKIEHIDNQIDE
jgi:hypothetical protein